MFGRLVPLVATTLMVGCSFTPPRRATPSEDDEPPREADVVDVDSPTDPSLHLLISEVMPSAGVAGSAEFVEIFNPTDQAIELATYYLSDDAEYWKLPAFPDEQMRMTDYLSRFPDGATIAAGGVAVIAVNGPDFLARFGMAPTFTLRDPVAGAAEMVRRFDTTDDGDNWITDNGELVALLRWDGVSDRVSDVDLVVHGSGVSGPNNLGAKEPVDGPDDGAETTAYATDALTIGEMADRAEDGESYKRIARESGETATGGNGLTGHDETTETIATSWDVGSSPATPFAVPDSLR